MSLPQRPLLPSNSGMDDKTPRITPNFAFPFCATSSPSSVFPPMPMFPAQIQQAYNTFMQAQLMQLAQQQQQQQRLSAGVSPTHSDQTSSRSESPMNSSKKLQLDEDGCAACPACGERIAEDQFQSHLEQEKTRLVNHITSDVEENLANWRRRYLREVHVKVVRMKDRNNCDSTFYDQSSTLKRESELARIRNNQQKRQILKRGSSNIMRDCLTPFSRQSNDETGSSESPDTKKDEEFSGTMKCSSCSQPCAYGIVMSAFDRPKCQMCFDIIRTQSCILTVDSPNGQIDEEEENSPVCKKMKLDTEQLGE